MHTAVKLHTTAQTEGKEGRIQFSFAPPKTREIR